MHRVLPRIYIFLEQFNHGIFNNNNINIGIIYRNYKTQNLTNDLKKIVKACKKKRYKLFISNNIKLAIKVKADGIYIPAFHKTRINFNNINNHKLLIIGSAHNQREIKIKIMQKCKAIFISPIFPIAKSKKYLGINKFNLLSLTSKVHIFALGGINEHSYNKLKMTKIEGFGGIGLFKKKPALKKAGFLKNNFFSIN